jgi:translation elongation factor EF-Tu-like GTPase
MALARNVEAEVTFLPTEHGGRKGFAPVLSGYRPQFYFECVDYDALHEYPDVPQVHPGETARVFLTFHHPELLVGRLLPGKPFLIREGHRVVGYGTVIRILQLEASAKRAKA